LIQCYWSPQPRFKYWASGVPPMFIAIISVGQKRYNYFLTHTIKRRKRVWSNDVSWSPEGRDGWIVWQSPPSLYRFFCFNGCSRRFDILITFDFGAIIIIDMFSVCRLYHIDLIRFWANIKRNWWRKYLLLRHHT